MKLKILIFTISLLLIWIGKFQLNAQNMIIKFNTGSETAKQLASLQKLTFNNYHLVLNYISGSNENYSISEINKLYFGTITTGITDNLITENVKSVNIFPNPVYDKINFQNLTEKISDIYIYRMDGAMVMKLQISGEENAIDVSYLSKGIYLLRVNNQTVKFSKI